MRHEHLPVCLARGNDWRNIPIALIEAEKVEAKAQTCDMALVSTLIWYTDTKHAVLMF
jgi:hypothetical protein